VHHPAHPLDQPIQAQSTQPIQPLTPPHQASLLWVRQTPTATLGWMWLQQAKVVVQVTQRLQAHILLNLNRLEMLMLQEIQ
jgi:exopolysaccharide biosynthesis predicted pyruvyltransferase EpsI